MEMVIEKEGLDIAPVYECGHYCKICKRVTAHRYIGPVRGRDGEIALYLWDCTVCGDTMSLDSPEKVGRRCFRRETRRMRQRREKRRYG